MTKSTLAIILSKLKPFSNPKVMLEQYPTDSEIAAEVVWHAYVHQDIENKTITDLGCGTGILGISALILGAKKVNFVDIDKSCVELAKQNLVQVEVNIDGQASFYNQGISAFTQKSDVILTNPPFGTKLKGADVEFLKKAFTLAPVIYTFHKLETKPFLKKFIEQNNYRITNEWSFKFPLKLSMQHHKKPVQKIDVVCFRIQKIL